MPRKKEKDLQVRREGRTTVASNRRGRKSKEDAEMERATNSVYTDTMGQFHRERAESATYYNDKVAKIFRRQWEQNRRDREESRKRYKKRIGRE